MAYSSYSSPFDQVNSFIRRSQIPATISLISISAILFLVDHFNDRVESLFTFSALPLVPIDGFSIFAYSLLTPDFISVVMACLVLYWCGGSLERSWGTVKFTLFFFAISAITGLGLVLGSEIVHSHTELLGIWIPLSSLIVAWATINPLLTVMVFGFIPIQARLIAIFEVGVIYFEYYRAAPLLGLFALMGPLAAFLAVRFGLVTGYGYRAPSGPDLRIINSSGSMRNRPLDDAGINMSLNPLNRLRAWQQRRRLAKLLQKSGFSERDEDRRSR